MISVGNNKAVICKGDFHPAALYKGDKKIAGYTTTEFSGEGGVTLENCYNDKLHNAQIIGNSIQDGTPTPEAPIEVQSVGELVTEGEYAGKYKVPVTVRGKNLFDQNIWRDLFDLTEEGYYQSNKFITVINSSKEFYLEAGTYSLSYTCKCPRGKNYRLMFVYEDGTSLNLYFASTGEWIERKQKITLPQKVVSVHWGYSSQSDSVCFKDIQIEYGNATPYEPYIEPQTFNIYLDEPLRKVGDYADFVDFGKDVVARKVRKRVFDGTEWWFFDGSTKNNTLSCQEKVESYTSGTSDKITALCNRLKGRTWSQIWQNYYKSSESTDLITGIAVVYNANDGTGQSYLYFKVSPYSTLPTIAEWVSQLAIWYEEGNPFTVWYIIPTTEEPIELPKLPQFKGTTIYEIDTQIPATISGKYKKFD